METAETCDAEADVLYVHFKKPSVATDSELTDDDSIVRYEGDEVIGFTILHAGERKPVDRTRLKTEMNRE